MAAAFRAEPLVTGIEYFAHVPGPAGVRPAGPRRRAPGRRGPRRRHGAGTRTVDGGVARWSYSTGARWSRPTWWSTPPGGRVVRWLAGRARLPTAGGVGGPLRLRLRQRRARSPRPRRHWRRRASSSCPTRAGASPGRGGYVARIEGGLLDWPVWAADWGTTRPPTCRSLARVRTHPLAVARLGRAGGHGPGGRRADGVPVPDRPSGATSSSWSASPRDWCALGDALCHVNPLYGARACRPPPDRSAPSTRSWTGRDRRSGNRGRTRPGVLRPGRSRSPGPRGRWPPARTC